MGQGSEQPPTIKINNYDPDVVHEFIYFGSTISGTLSLDNEIIRWAATLFTKLISRAWENRKLTANTEIAVYKTCSVAARLAASTINRRDASVP